MCKIIGMEVSCRCVPVALPLLTANQAWGVLGRRFEAAHSEEAPAPNQAPARRATPVLRTSQPDCNIRPSSPSPLRIAPLFLQPRPSTRHAAGAERQSSRPRLPRYLGAVSPDIGGRRPVLDSRSGRTHLPASPFRDRFMTVKSRTRSKPYDYKGTYDHVRPTMGRSRARARLPQPHSV